MIDLPGAIDSAIATYEIFCCIVAAVQTNATVSYSSTLRRIFTAVLGTYYLNRLMRTHTLTMDRAAPLAIMAQAHFASGCLLQTKSIPHCDCKPGYGDYACQQAVRELKAPSGAQAEAQTFIRNDIALQYNQEEHYEINVSKSCNENLC